MVKSPEIGLVRFCAAEFQNLTNLTSRNGQTGAPAAACTPARLLVSGFRGWEAARARPGARRRSRDVAREPTRLAVGAPGRGPSADRGVA